MKKNKRSKGSIFMAIILILSILVPNIVFADEHIITLEAESL